MCRSDRMTFNGLSDFESLMLLVNSFDLSPLTRKIPINLRHAQCFVVINKTNYGSGNVRWWWHCSCLQLGLKEMSCSVVRLWCSLCWVTVSRRLITVTSVQQNSQICSSTPWETGGVRGQWQQEAGSSTVQFHRPHHVLLSHSPQDFQGSLTDLMQTQRCSETRGETHEKEGSCVKNQKIIRWLRLS